MICLFIHSDIKDIRYGILRQGNLLLIPELEMQKQFSEISSIMKNITACIKAG